MESEQLSSEQLGQVYLIKPRWLSTDIVYKVFIKGDDICFCKVGGQFYGIRDNGEDITSFTINKVSLASVNISRVKSRWTGQIPNNGAVFLEFGGKKEKFIIHPIQEAEKVFDFFNDIGGMEVKYIDQAFIQKQESQKKKYNPELFKGSFEYKRLYKVTRVLNILGWIFGVWFLMYPRPLYFLMFINILLPAVGFFIYARFNKYIEFDEKKGVKHPTVVTAVILPSVILTLRAMLDFNVLYTGPFWIFAAVVSIAILGAILRYSIEYKVKKWLPFFMIIFIFSYVFGTLTLTNCLLDTSKAVKYTTYITGKDVETGKITTYHLSVKPWGPVTENGDIIVSKRLYDNAETGGELFVYLKGGTWGIPWFIPDLQ